MHPLIPTEDFWSRQAHRQQHAHTFHALGTPVLISANRPTLLLAARLTSGRYSQASPANADADGIRIQIIERDAPAAPPPAHWPEQLIYSGVGEWISLSAGEWGYGVGDRCRRTAFAVLAQTLARQTHLVSRYVLDHYVLNFLFNDWAMLHASSVLDPSGRTLLVMIGAHNAGKSTTALRLLRAGWRFLADGMLLVQKREGRLIAGGYPIGEVKLRDDVLAQFPDYTGETHVVREQRKTVIDLRAAHPQGVVETLVSPITIHLCFTERGAGPRTLLTPLTAETARQRLAANTVYWDEPEHLQHNSATLHHLIDLAHLHRLTLGSDVDELIATLETL